MRTFGLLALVVAASANGGWTYVNQDDWGKDFDGCLASTDLQKQQSPINLYTGLTGEDTTTGFGPLKVQFESTASGTWENTGHTISLTFDSDAGTTASGGHMAVEGFEEGFDLIALHFHSPSEHVVDGKSYPLEGHFYHRNGAVVSVFFDDETDQENDQLQVLFEGVPIIGAKRHIESINLGALLPDDSRFFSYIGSTTTPPCTPGVKWAIFEKPVAISTNQLGRFNRYYRGNNRKLQELKAGRYATLNAAASQGKSFPDLTREFEFPLYDEPQIPL